MTRERGTGGNNGQGMNWIRKAKRFAIYERDCWRCVWCWNQVGSTAKGSPHGLDEESRLALAPIRVATLDHVLPRCLGGSNHESNLITSCADCNEQRGGLVAIEFACMLDERANMACEILDRIIEAMGKPLKKAAP